MTAYSIRLSVQSVPFLVSSSHSRMLFRRFNTFLVLAAVINVLLW